jgi:hypothetical protein
VLVIDGGTSVADLDYIDPIRGDVAWCVQHVAAALEEIAPSNRSQQDSVQAAIGVVRARFDHATAGFAVPAYAWPIAALTWVRLVEHDGHLQATLHSLGDCKTLLRAANGAVSDPDPFVNP